MKSYPRARFSAYQRAFSLIELMIAVGLLSFVILGLLLMFNQVQKAFRASMTQTDVLESGRAIADMIARDLEQMTPSQLANSTNVIPCRATNFFAEIYTNDFNQALLQHLPGATQNPDRTNVVQQFFFVAKENQSYVGIGYKVVADHPNGLLGTLYRHKATANKFSGLSPLLLSSNYLFASRYTTNLHRIADGIVHLRLRAFDTNGAPFFYTNTFLSFWSTNYSLRTGWVPLLNTYGSDDCIRDQIKYVFLSNAVPAAIELEVGFLEPHLLDRYRAFAEADTSGIAGSNYLAKHAASVHIFRQRIPVRAVDYLAYR